MLAAVGLAEVAVHRRPDGRRDLDRRRAGGTGPADPRRARSTIPTPPSCAPRSRSRAASRSRWGSARTSWTHLRAAAGARARATTSSCSPAAPRRVRAIWRTRRSAGCERPGIIVHGVALKPGKPLVHRGHRRPSRRGAAGLPDLGDLHLPRVRRTARSAPWPACRRTRRETMPGDARRAHALRARPHRISHGLAGRDRGSGLAAYPTAKGSGSVTAFSQADGFVAVPSPDRGRGGRHPGRGASHRPARAPARPRPDRQPLPRAGPDHRPARGARASRSRRWTSAAQAGSAAARRGECDLAGVHLLDPATGLYNRHLTRLRGFRAGPRLPPAAGPRLPAGDARFAPARPRPTALAAALADPAA